VTAAFSLRAWQAEAIPVVLEALAAGRRGVVSAVMGAGKSILIRETVTRWLAVPGNAELGPVVVTTPSVKLVEQLGETFGETLERVGLFYTRRKDGDSPVIVCCNASAPALAQHLAGRRVGLWVADEVHRSESSGLLEAAEGFQAHAAFAVTATPYRSDGREKISLFDEVLYRYTPGDALRDGVIVPWRIVGWEGREASVDDACLELIREHRAGPGIVNATTIEDAVAFAGKLTRAGIRAEAIHSELHRDEQKDRLARLRTGATVPGDGGLDALVHVSLLTEGVDLPWLRWLCLRRPVGARVRFVQEVGRVLRADRTDPTKTEALLLDPHDLFGVFGLSYEAALGWYEPPPAEPAPEEREEDPEEQTEQGRRERRIRSKDSVSAWARQLLLALQADGIADESAVTGNEWRRLPPTDPQLVQLGRVSRRMRTLLPVEHGRAFGAVAKARKLLSRGIASDLMSVAFALKKHGEPWVPVVDVAPPDPRQIAAVAAQVLPEDERVSCAGVLLGGVAAVAVLKGDEVVFQRARPGRDGDTRTYLRESAIRIATEHGANPVADTEAARQVAMSVARRFTRERG
jgi:superfamily II DNA or RNA helicase